MAEWNVGKKNGMWRGGRSVASNGYVLIRVGIGHPDADVRGYAYEHRIVMQRKLGRKLREGEQVHHRDENKQNNDPDNLVLAETCAHHRVYHRKKSLSNGLPGEDNPLIPCACGCGESIAKYDEFGRPRVYISGHNDHPSPTMDKILTMIK